MSTLCQLFTFVTCLLSAGYRSLTINYDDKSAEEVFKMFSLCYSRLPKELKVRRKKSNKKEMAFHTESEASVSTCDNKNLGSAYTCHIVHITELGKWPGNPKTALNSLFQTVPDYPGTAIFMESTAHGVGTYFHDKWMKDEEGTKYVRVFLPWFIHEEYSRKFKNKAEKESFLDNLQIEERDYFLDLMGRFSGQWLGPDGNYYEGLTLEKLNWYHRDCLIDKCEGDRLMRQQEYPNTDDEAFVSTSPTAFKVERIVELRKQLQALVDRKGTSKKDGENYYYYKDGRKTGVLIRDANGKVSFEENPYGSWRIVKFPEKNQNYMATGDVAEGLAENDNSIIDVTHREKFEQVAQFCSNKIDPDVLAEEFMKASDFYNECWIAPENNKDGWATIREILKTVKPKLFSKTYVARVYSEVNFDKTADKNKKDKAGWSTNSKTRPLLVAKIKAQLSEGSYKFNFLETISEFETFLKGKDGKPKAAPGKRDDRVITAGITFMLHEVLPLRICKAVQRLTDGQSIIESISGKEKSNEWSEYS